MESTSKDSAAESALFDDDEEELEEGEISEEVKNSSQHVKSRDRSPLVFEEIESKGGNHVQTISELQTVPVVVTADMTKSRSSSPSHSSPSHSAPSHSALDDADCFA